MISKILLRIEGVAARLQGKGWGAGTVAKEFGACVSLLGHKDVALCVDIGANKGTYTTEICRTFPDAKVVAFEPAAVNLQALNEKFADNTSVLIEPYAVSKDDGEATLFSNTAGSSLASLTKRRLDHYNISFENTETIRTIVFEDYW
ncbi:MAG: FkbM family methyltransferase, partial [Silicimonas sp.]|nr:FkbM family methyltransferase [Silicimonas sp.]